jgi:hypothetical protein
LTIFYDIGKDKISIRKTNQFQYRINFFFTNTLSTGNQLRSPGPTDPGFPQKNSRPFPTKILLRHFRFILQTPLHQKILIIKNLNETSKTKWRIFRKAYPTLQGQPNILWTRYLKLVTSPASHKPKRILAIVEDMTFF